MAQDIDTGIKGFYMKFNKTGVFHPYRFRAELIHGENIFNKTEYAGYFDENFTFFVNSTQLPGKNITENTVGFLGMDFTMPNNVTYDKEIDLTVICDSDMKIRTMFEKWMDESSGLGLAGGGNKKLRPAHLQLVLLKTDLKTQINKYILKGCWPKRLGTVNLDHTGTGHSTFTASLAYQYYVPSMDGV